MVSVRFQPTVAGQLQRYGRGQRRPDRRVEHAEHQRQRYGAWCTRAHGAAATSWSAATAPAPCRITSAVAAASSARYRPANQLSLTQNESKVSGFDIARSGHRPGTVRPTPTARSCARARANSGQSMSLSLSSWTSSASAASMSGNFSYNATFSGLPGVAVVVSRLSGVTRR